ncbi:hypothetical protein LTSEURB_2958 [Salmonella enterica subsp. enterica serovar Urbana str. R8-2977]|uniref:Uncharacterized protein n=1 Tax=Salmonella enterica subsp. enterica serovar Urbana str. R8-2977 TaxID=913084 RepID=G5RWP4_SALET|nr:hypothetical protein LTSEURB_2958 [Salmonella enterica subsp. enterica serovar Urbana str. R8-2977]
MLLQVLSMLSQMYLQQPPNQMLPQYPRFVSGWVQSLSFPLHFRR